MFIEVSSVHCACMVIFCSRLNTVLETQENKLVAKNKNFGPLKFFYILLHKEQKDQTQLITTLERPLPFALYQQNRAIEAITVTLRFFMALCLSMGKT